MRGEPHRVLILIWSQSYIVSPLQSIGTEKPNLRESVLWHYIVEPWGNVEAAY
jgi:hypothetical protein